MLRPVQATLSHTMPAAAHTFLIDSILFDCLICGLPSRHFCRGKAESRAQRWLTSVSSPPRGNGLAVAATRYQPASSLPQETGLVIGAPACCCRRSTTPFELAQLPTEPASRRRARAALLAADLRWLDTLHLFNEGFSWGAHEDWGQWYGFHPDDTRGQFRPGARPPRFRRCEHPRGDLPGRLFMTRSSAAAGCRSVAAARTAGSERTARADCEAPSARSAPRHARGPASPR